MSELTIRQIAEQIDNHPLCAFTLEQITDAVKALAAHVLASTEPLGDGIRAVIANATESYFRGHLVPASEMADLRAQLQAAQQERERYVSHRAAAIAAEKHDAEKALLALSAAHYATPAEGYGFNSSWAISDLCRAVKSIQQLADERGRENGELFAEKVSLEQVNARLHQEIEQRKAGLQDTMAHYRAELDERGREVERLREAFEALGRRGCHEVANSGKRCSDASMFLYSDWCDGCIINDALATPAATPPAHLYTSTACQHGLHDRCRDNCKFCGTPCLCLCGHETVPPPAQEHPDTARLDWLFGQGEGPDTKLISQILMDTNSVDEARQLIDMYAARTAPEAQR